MLDKKDGSVLVLVSTTSQPRKNPLNYYDQFKIPIHNWRKSGLSKPSWCKGKLLIELKEDDLSSIVNEDDYIGKVLPQDFDFIVDELEKIHGK